MYGLPVKVYAKDIRLSSHPMVLEEDILQDRKDVRYVSCLSSGMEYGVHAAAVGLGQTLGTQKIEEEQGL
jgi:hypothetical protein